MAYRLHLAYSSPPQVPILDAADPINRGLVGWWRMDQSDIVGTTIRDISTTRTNGTLVASPSLSPGKIGQGLHFNGTTQYISLGTPASLEGLQVPLTITSWFRPEQIAPTRAIYGAYQSTSGHNLWSLLRIDSGVLKYYASTTSGTFQSGGTLAVTNSVWSFFAVVVSGSIATPTVTLYVNSSTETISYSAFSSTPSTIPIYLGSDAAGGDQAQGILDETRVYNRALSIAEISRIRSDTTGGLGLVKPSLWLANVPVTTSFIPRLIRWGA